jgi:hypothetical protein
MLNWLFKMRWSSLAAAAAALGLAASTQGLNILLNNDDGFGSGNIREVYRLLKEKGHDGSSPTYPIGPATWLCHELCNTHFGDYPLKID